MSLIVQMFNLPFKAIQRKLPRMARLGVSHLLVSPPQKSNPSRSWWGRYQPVDFRFIESPLGNGHDLYQLCQKAGGRGIRVIADAVLNHMTNHPGYIHMRHGRVLESHLPRFGPQDFHTPESNRESGRPTLGFGAHSLPELKTHTPWVRSELRDYLWMLYRIGVRGFRFDAAKHIDPHFFPFALNGMRDILCFGELIYTHASQVPGDYLRSMQSYDFPLARCLREAFDYHGDLRMLMDPAGHDSALWGPLSVSFVNHHDFARRGGAFKHFKISDQRDRSLAYSYILARGEGTPLIYYNDLRRPEVKGAMTFHRITRGESRRWLQGNKVSLIWSRGRSALAALNKSLSPLYFNTLGTDLLPGVYQNILGGRMAVDSRGVAYNFGVPARGAALFVKVG